MQRKKKTNFKFRQVELKHFNAEAVLNESSEGSINARHSSLPINLKTMKKTVEKQAIKRISPPKHAETLATDLNQY